MEGFKYSDKFLQKLREKFPHANFILTQADKGMVMMVEDHLKKKGEFDLLDMSQDETKRFQRAKVAVVLAEKV